MNVPRGSVIVTAGGVTLTENSDYTVDYSMGIVTITNQSIIDSGQSISVTLENQSLFSMQRKTLLGLDLQYQFTPELNLGATLMHFSEKALTEKVNIGDEIVNNTMLGFNLSYNTQFMWLTNLLNKIPTVTAHAAVAAEPDGRVRTSCCRTRRSRGRTAARRTSTTSSRPRRASTCARLIRGSWPRRRMIRRRTRCSRRRR